MLLVRIVPRTCNLIVCEMHYERLSVVGGGLLRRLVESAAVIDSKCDFDRPISLLATLFHVMFCDVV